MATGTQFCHTTFAVLSVLLVLKNTVCLGDDDSTEDSSGLKCWPYCSGIPKPFNYEDCDSALRECCLPNSATQYRSIYDRSNTQHVCGFYFAQNDDDDDEPEWQNDDDDDEPEWDGVFNNLCDFVSFRKQYRYIDFHYCSYFVRIKGNYVSQTQIVSQKMSSSGLFIVHLGLVVPSEPVAWMNKTEMFTLH